jgi:hypothetical protein
MVACPRSGTLEVHGRSLAIQKIADREINSDCGDRMVFLLVELGGLFYLGEAKGPMRASRISSDSPPFIHISPLARSSGSPTLV